MGEAYHGARRSRPAEELKTVAMAKGRTLYISTTDMRAQNGMAQGQQQLLEALVAVHGESVDLLSLGAFPSVARKWLRNVGLQVRVLDGSYPLLACVNCIAWYGGGVVVCNKLRWMKRFYFPVATPLPQSWIDLYDRIVAYYVWPYHLLRLDRAGGKVVVDTGDIMADRHERIGVRRWISLRAGDEKAVLTSEARCLAVSRDDADEFERLYATRPRVISFVPPEHKQLLEVASVPAPACVGFMGAPSYVNEEIVRLLARPEFLNALRAAGFELAVAGGICATIDPSVSAALRAGGARILGRVRSTADYYRQIRATVNPVGPSTGVKIKSVETLVAGKVLITTRWGADATLAAAFPDQVAYVDWPIDPTTLADVCIRAVRAPITGARAAAETYIQNASRTLQEMIAQ